MLWNISFLQFNYTTEIINMYETHWWTFLSSGNFEKWINFGQDGKFIVLATTVLWYKYEYILLCYHRPGGRFKIKMPPYKYWNINMIQIRLTAVLSLYMERRSLYWTRVYIDMSKIWKSSFLTRVWRPYPWPCGSLFHNFPSDLIIKIQFTYWISRSHLTCMAAA